MSTGSEPAIKDERAQLPVPSVWRPTLSKIVEAFVQRDYSLQRGVGGVAAVPKSTADQIELYIADYGETLVDLPEEAWKTSVSLWMRTYWDVFVDLFTDESGASDMVLSVRVFEDVDDYRFEVDSVHVP
jgi:hypothetical protein